MNLIKKYYQKTNSAKNIKNFNPFKYQEEVAEAVLNGENIILQAPTGAGKTLASIMPFIIANEEDMNFPTKMIYSTPRRTLVNSLYEDIVIEIGQGDFTQEFTITIQTGENKEDRYLTGDVIFTTFDQSLSSVLSMPISLSNRLGNINVAAVLSSYLIFDEFHLFDLEKSYTTTILLLEKLKNISPFCIMTATISDEKIKYLSNKLDAKVIRADSYYYLQDIVTQQGKKRRIFTKNYPLDAEKIVELHNKINNDNDGSKKSIVMCNRVENAQQIYKQIKEIATSNTDVILIHSRFLNKDRKRKEDKIKELFKKENKSSNVILISTQVIEVGIDITSHIMHTEISVIDSFLQRIGRCARYMNEKGTIYVYDVLNEGESKYLPYNEVATIKTYEALREINGCILTSELSQKIIDRVYSKETDIDKKANERVNNTRGGFITESWRLPNKKKFKELVRDVIGCSIIIKRWVVEKQSPYNYPSLSISPWTLRKKIKELVQVTDEWLIKEVIERDDDSDIKYTYREITVKDIYPNNLYILNPEYFAYSKEEGLLFGQKGECFELIPYSNREDIYDNDYKEESYLEHIQRMKQEVTEIERELSHIINHIKGEYDLTDDNFRDIVEFIIWSHDLGKLQRDWLLAHRREKHKYIAHAERYNKPPSHAVESFRIVLYLLEDFVFDYLDKDDKLIDIMGKAIISHHTLNVVRYDKYSISKDAVKYLNRINFKYFSKEELSKFISTNMERLNLKEMNGDDIIDDIVVEWDNELLLYYVLVRILRLTDQRATKKLNE